jgi:hypothetical protein
VPPPQMAGINPGNARLLSGIFGGNNPQLGFEGMPLLFARKVLLLFADRALYRLLGHINQQLFQLRLGNPAG